LVLASEIETGRVNGAIGLIDSSRASGDVAQALATSTLTNTVATNYTTLENKINADIQTEKTRNNLITDEIAANIQALTSFSSDDLDSLRELEDFFGAGDERSTKIIDVMCRRMRMNDDRLNTLIGPLPSPYDKIDPRIIAHENSTVPESQRLTTFFNAAHHANKRIWLRREGASDILKLTHDLVISGDYVEFGSKDFHGSAVGKDFEHFVEVTGKIVIGAHSTLVEGIHFKMAELIGIGFNATSVNATFRDCKFEYTGTFNNEAKLMNGSGMHLQGDLIFENCHCIGWQNWMLADPVTNSSDPTNVLDTAFVDKNYFDKVGGSFALRGHEASPMAWAKYTNNVSDYLNISDWIWAVIEINNCDDVLISGNTVTGMLHDPNHLERHFAQVWHANNAYEVNISNNVATDFDLYAGVIMSTDYYRPSTLNIQAANNALGDTPVFASFVFKKNGLTGPDYRAFLNNAASYNPENRYPDYPHMPAIIPASNVPTIPAGIDPVFNPLT
jgi:hypothetical protein